MKLTSSQITEILNGYIKHIEDSGKVYWNADTTPTKENWGLTNKKCDGENPLDNAPPDDKCVSNKFGDGWQCNGFARFIAYLLTGIVIGQVNDKSGDVGGGWIKKLI